MLISVSFWVLYMVFVFIVPIMVISYQRKLAFKHKDVTAILSGELGKKYLKSYYPESVKNIKAENREDSWQNAIREKIDEYFENEYAFSNFLLPISAFLLISAVALLLSLSRIYSFVSISSEEYAFLEKIPVNVYLGFFGAFIFSIIETSRRYINTNLSPLFLYSVTSKLLLCSILGFIWGIVFGKDIALLASFGTGFISLQKIENYIVKHTEKKLEGKKQVISTTDLSHIQGLDSRIIDRLEEVRITSCQALAYCDPIKLLFSTNYQLKIIVDWIDQALLYVYIGEKVNLLRDGGIRGVIEFASLYELKDDKPKLLISIAKELKLETIEELGNFLDNVYDDPHVDFIWYLFGEYSDDKEN